MLTSKVPGHEGPCAPTWLNQNEVFNRLDGGVTGFFRLIKTRWGIFTRVKTGPKFHGIIVGDEVHSTKGLT